jgi:glycosyltransferase involved in cell wall biosynthesis
MDKALHETRYDHVAGAGRLPVRTVERQKTRMNVLFVHQNFPAQFKSLAPALVERGHRVAAMTMRELTGGRYQGVDVIRYSAGRSSTITLPPAMRDLEAKVIRGEAAFNCALKLRAEGFQPDVIIAHPGWGESLFLKDVWPQARIAIYCEFYYRPTGADVDYDPEFATKDERQAYRTRLKNLHTLAHFEFADAGISPTLWQANTYPSLFRNKISVIHDGIDTTIACPNLGTTLSLNNKISLSSCDEIVTFVNRNLEPYRGYHIFMRSLPEILRRRPRARVMIVGGDGVSYGSAPGGDEKRSWKQIFIDEVRGEISDEDWGRVHFLGHIPYTTFIQLLQISTVHLYLTYPFVLSWSMLEAMSIGCAIVASKTPPVQELIEDGRTGILVDFFAKDRLVEAVCTLLDDKDARGQMGRRARELIVERYDLKSRCLPQQIKWAESLHERGNDTASLGAPFNGVSGGA